MPAPVGWGQREGTELFFLKCNKIYQGAGQAAVKFWDPADRATEAAPWQALQQWAVGGWMVRVRVGCAGPLLLEQLSHLF